MKECFSCCWVSMLIGVVVGGVLVASNKKLEKTVKDGTELAKEKIEEIKDKIVENSKKSKNSEK